MRTKGLLRRASAVLLLPLLAGCAVGPADSGSSAPAEPLFSQIDYRFVGDQGEVDDEGRTLVWVATMEGDLSAEGRWYFESNAIPNVEVAEGSIVYYEARWEVRVDDRVILEGWSAGKTVPLHGGDFIWDGHGVVMSASADYGAYVGHPIYETGPVIEGEDSSAAARGRGLFAIY